MRILFSLVLASSLCLGMFFTMHLMISSDNQLKQESSQTTHLVYLREKKETIIEKKKREKPKEPIKKPVLKKIKLIKTPLVVKTNKNIKIVPFKIAQEKINLSAISSLGGAQIEMSQGILDANLLNALRKSNPRYPRRAKIKKLHGFTQLIFTINKEGTVSNVRVLDSNPKGIFEKNSIKAIKRWKFKRNHIAQDATITFNFRLAE